ncbi:MAG: hypothetical protein VX794_02970 [Nitrospinota bacterium]|nr:hypothetical protein [Nitrospinota bacterium]
MFDLEEFLSSHDSLMREFSFTLNLNLFDAEDIVQEVVLLSIEDSNSTDSQLDIYKWFMVEIAKHSRKRNRDKTALPLYEFDFPDFAPFLQEDYKEQVSSMKNLNIETSFEFLFFLQYMNFEERLILVLKNYFKNDYISLSSEILEIEERKVLEILEDSKKQYSLIFNKWKKNIPFPDSNGSVKTDQLIKEFLSALRSRNRVLLEKIFLNDVELVVSEEKRTGNEFVSTACLELLKKSGKILHLDLIELNGCFGFLVWSRSDNNSEWSRSAVILFLADEKFICSLKWYMDGHLFRNIVCQNPVIS